jgi:single-strand DNA-binding protein
MSSYQKVIICGNIGRDPEIKYTQNGTAVCSLSVATSRSWKDKNSGERQEETEWHRVVAYDRLAEILGEYTKKGSKVLIDGRLKTRKWEDKDGIERYTTEIVAESMQMLDPKSDGERTERPRSQSQQRSGQQRTQGGQGKSQGGFDDMDDDIPF